MDLPEFEASLFYSASFRVASGRRRETLGGEKTERMGQEMLLPPTHTHTTPTTTPSPRDSTGTLEPRTRGPANPASAHAPWARRQVSPGQRARARPSAEPEKRLAARAAGHLFLAQALPLSSAPAPPPRKCR